MHLTHLSLTNFRNFSRLDVDVPEGAVLIVGDNAQGKTSLLEAVYYLATFVSFQASHDRQLINFLAVREPLAVARIVGEYAYASQDIETQGFTSHGLGPTGSSPESQAVHHLEVRVIQEPNGNGGGSRLRKEVLLDGVKHKFSEVVGKFNAVLFLPQMMGVIEGAPEERRRYLNLALGQALPSYAVALSTYTRALSQRNALLKQLNERGGDQAQLDFWDEQLAYSGAYLIHARIQAVQELEHLAVHLHQDLTQGSEVLRMCYQPAYDPLPAPMGQFALPIDAPVDRSRIALDHIRQGFQEKLLSLRKEEIARGVTVTGPHRDELRFLSNAIDLGLYGSRGQVRTAMLAIKLAEVAWMEARTGHQPVLLLDEVLAELDTRRRADLLSRLGQGKQVLLTTTDLKLFDPGFVQGGTVWHIQGGQFT